MADLPNRADLTGLDGVTHDVTVIAWALYVAEYAEDAEQEVETTLESQPSLIPLWQSMWDATEHSGDCTNEIHSCLICKRERLVYEAEAVLNALPE